MMKNVLFIENDFSDFQKFSTIMKDKGYFTIYPQKITSQDDLYGFLKNDTYDNMKNAIFEYIKTNMLYKKLSVIVLDINLIEKGSDKYGLNLLSDFRNDFSDFLNLEEYEEWSKIITVVALTTFKKKYNNEFLKSPGYLFDVFYKKEVIANSETFINKLNNFNEEMNTNKQLLSVSKTEVHNHYGDNFNGDKIGGDKVEGNQAKTAGKKSPIILNIVQSEIELENKLAPHNVKPEDTNELLQILRTERIVPNNETLISKMKEWWNKVKSYARDLSVEILGNLLVSLYLLPADQVALVIQEIQQ